MFIEYVRDYILGLQTLVTADLQLSSTCHTAREKLLGYLGDDKIFSKELSQYFEQGEAGVPYNISPQDPSQVAVLKKIINAFSHAEKAFKVLEDVKVSDDRFLVSIAADYVKNGYGAVNEIYDAIRLINTSSPDVQAIVGPHLQALLPKLEKATKALDNFTPSNVGHMTAQAVGATVDMLPEEIPTEGESLGQVSQFIFSLPGYFEALQAQLPTGAAGEVSKKITTAAGYKEAMSKRAQKATQHFEKLAHGNGGVFSLPSYVATLATLAEHGTELVGTAAPLTNNAYIAAVERLNQIRHTLLPNLIVELEQVEEGMALHPGTLVDPAIEHMEIYYEQIAGYVNGIANAAGVLDSAVDLTNSNYGAIARKLMGGVKVEQGEKVTPVADLDVLRDEHFEAYTNKQRTERFVQAQLSANDTSELTAATDFFNRLKSLNWTTHRWRLGTATPEVKAALLDDYKKIQLHFAALYPQVDSLIVASLGGVDIRAASSRVGAAYAVVATNEFDTIMKCKETVIESIEQSLSQQKFRSKVIQEAAAHHKAELLAARDFKTKLKAEVHPFQGIEFVVPSRGQPALSSKQYEEKRLAFAVQLHNLEKAQIALDVFKTEQSLDCERLLFLLTDDDIESLFKHYSKHYAHWLGDEFDENQKEELLRLVVNTIVGSNHGVAGVYEQISQSLELPDWGFEADEIEENQDKLSDEALERLFTKIRQQHQDNSPNISQLNEDRKESFRKAYKEFQSLVVEGDDAEEIVVSLNDQIVDALSSEDWNPLKYSQLQFMVQRVDAKLKGLLETTTEAIRDYSKLITRAKAQELALVELVAMGNKLEEKTLFGQLRILKLSETLDKFIKNNSPPGKLPFKEFYKDSPDVQIHKKLINAMHHLKTTLATLESLDGSDPGNTVTRALYLRHFVYVVLDLVAIKTALTDAAYNPALATIISEGSKVLAPLLRIPIVGDYIRTTMESAPGAQQSPARDIIEEWRWQQSIVESMRLGGPLPSTGAPAPVARSGKNTRTAAVTAADTSESQLYQRIITTIADQIYNIPQHIRVLRIGVDAAENDPQAEAILAKKTAFIRRLSSLSYGPGSLGSILTAIQESMIQLTEIGAESRALVLDRISELPSIVGGSLINLADTTEFNLGFTGPGELSSRLETEFNQFYASLIDSLPVSEEEQALLILNGKVGLKQARLANEEARLEVLVNTRDSVEEQERTKIFGFFNVLKERREEGYQTEALQHRFLRDYARLQPTLAQINPSFDISGFVRALQTPKNFASSAVKIIKLEKTLNTFIVKGVLGTRDKEISRCRERITMLQGDLEETTFNAEIKFKERLAQKHLNAVRELYIDALGPYGNLFFEKIDREFLTRRDYIFATANIANEDTSVSIEAQVLQMQSEVLRENAELYGAYQGLNESLVKLQTVIRAEQAVLAANPNPCRGKKLELLTAEVNRLLAEGLFTVDSSVVVIQAQQQTTESYFSQLNKDHNSLIKAFDMLQEMHNYISKQPDNLKINKIAKIEEMQAILSDEAQTPTARLSAVANLATSDESKKILLKNSDNIFVRLVKTFWALITSWKGEEEQTVNRFREDFNQIKVTHTDTAAAPDQALPADPEQEGGPDEPAVGP